MGVHAWLLHRQRRQLRDNHLRGGLGLKRRARSGGALVLATNDTLDARFHAVRVQWEFMPGFCIVVLLLGHCQEVSFSLLLEIPFHGLNVVLRRTNLFGPSTLLAPKSTANTARSSGVVVPG